MTQVSHITIIAQLRISLKVEKTKDRGRELAAK